jgi:hypothetical protein
MWVIIKIDDSTVVGTQTGEDKPLWGADFEVFEWFGTEPHIHDPDDGVVSYDPRITATWSNVRAHRDVLLSRCDWTQMPDSPLSAGQKEMWVIYRQQLRDVPNGFAAPEDVVWPTTPEV